MQSNYHNSRQQKEDAKQIESRVALAPSCAPEESSLQDARSEMTQECPKTRARRIPHADRKTEKAMAKEECSHNYSSDESSEFEKESKPGAFGVAGFLTEHEPILEEDKPALDYEANIYDGDIKDRAMLVEADLAPEVTAAEEVNIQEEEAMIIKRKQYKRVLWFAMLFYGMAIIGCIISFVLLFVNPPPAFGRFYKPLWNGLLEAAIFVFVATCVVFVPTTRVGCRSSIKLEEYAPNDRRLLRQVQIASCLSFCIFTFVAIPILISLPDLQWLGYAFMMWFFAGTVFSFSRIWLLRQSKESRQKKPKIFWLCFVVIFIGLTGLTVWSCMNPKYPDCQVPDTTFLGNGICDHEQPYSSEVCGYDGGDCFHVLQEYPNCTVPFSSWIGDGFCDGRVYGTVECGYDGGDCLKPGERCRRHNECASEICNYNTKVCDPPFVSDRFPNCTVEMPHWIGDGECDGGYYASEACGFDGGDCLKLGESCSKDEECASAFCNETSRVCYLGILEKYPDCVVEYPNKIGNGECDGGYYGTEECGYDGGDCASQQSAGPPNPLQLFTLLPLLFTFFQLIL